MAHIAILTFPGNNCETETLRAVHNAGMTGEIFLWNREADQLKTFDGVVIPGGFSFEDRGRSGIISAQEPVIDTLKEMAKTGTPIIGICNGAQIVVESGLILASENDIPLVSLSRNKRKNSSGEVLGTGFYHSWRTLINSNNKTPFSGISNTMHIPIAHGEGRFVFSKEAEKEVREKNLVVFQYTDSEGNIDKHYPINPNGSFDNAAAVCNPAGNVLAMMPHPERDEDGSIVFLSLKMFLDSQDKTKLNQEKMSLFKTPTREIFSSPQNDITFFVQLKITDKTEKTIESVLHKKSYSTAKVTRRIKWGMNFSGNTTKKDREKKAVQIICSNELLNANKESVLVKISETFFQFSGGNLQEIPSPLSPEKSFEVRENEDVVGESKQSHLNHIFPDWEIESLSHGTVWTIEGIEKSEILKTPLFASFVGEKVFDL